MMSPEMINKLRKDLREQAAQAAARGSTTENPGPGGTGDPEARKDLASDFEAEAGQEHAPPNSESNILNEMIPEFTATASGADGDAAPLE